MSMISLTSVRAAPDPTIWAAVGLALVFTVSPARPDLEIAAAIAFASLLSSLAGFAFSAICGAILFHLSPDKVHIVQVMMTCSVANQALMTFSVRSEIQGAALARCLMGGLLGLPLGLFLLLHMEVKQYIAALGVFLVGYAAFMLVRKPVVVAHRSAFADGVAGFLGGVTGGAAAFPGAFVTIWCGMKGLSKEKQRGVFQPYILAMQVAGLVALAFVRPGTGVGYDPKDLLLIPYGLAGTAIGMRLYKSMSDWQFNRAVNVLLLASGASYLL